jgi:hypothetical protein
MGNLTKKEKCFVAMPIGETNEIHNEIYWKKHFDYLESLINRIDVLEAKRSEPLRGDILKEIITQLVSSKIVVVDITDYNSNVFWELGVRQSFKNGTVTIAEFGTKPPFDISGKGILFYYPKDLQKNQDFERDFLKALNDCIEKPTSFDSHVLETISGRGTVFEIINKDETIRKLEGLISEVKFNLSSLEKILTLTDVNQKTKNPKDGRTVHTFRLRNSSLTLLATTRYFDTTHQNYTVIENDLSNIVKINTQLDRWPSSPDEVEKWFIKTNDIFKKSLNSIKEMAEKEIEKLKSSV